MSDKNEKEVEEAQPVGDSALLAQLGYKQQLKREFTMYEIFANLYSVDATVPSVAAVLVFSLPNGGGPAMIWGWATASVFLMFMALAMAEMASSAPTSGGIYYWTHRLSPPKYRNIMCWIVGYTNTITYITAVAGADWSCAVALMAGVNIGSDGAFVATHHQTFGVFCAVLFAHALIASCATKIIARLQHGFAALNLILVGIMLIGLPIATDAEFKNTAKYAFGGFENITPWPNGYAFILSFLAPLWSTGGFDLNIHISEEVQNANVAVPWSIVSATAVSCVLGLAVQISVAFCMGTDTLSILSSPIQQPMAVILLNSFGKKGMLALWSLIFSSLFIAVISLLMSSSRQIFAFSRDGALPFSRFLYHINSFTGTPVRCVWFAATSSALIGLISFAGPAATGALFSLGVVGQYVADSIPITARWLGGQEFKRGPFHLGLFSKPVAIIAVLWMWFMTIVLMFPSAPNPTSDTMNYTVVVIGGVLSFALMYYYFPRYGGVHWFQGPVRNVEVDVDENAEKLSDI